MTKSERNEQIEIIENEFSSIFYNVIDLEDISLFNENLIKLKLELLHDHIEEFIDVVAEDNDRKLEQLQKLNTKYSRLIKLFLVASVLIPVVGIPLLLYFMYKKNLLENDFEEVLTFRELDEIGKKFAGITNIVENIETFLKVKVEKRKQKTRYDQLKNEKDVYNMILANSYLEMFFEGKMPVRFLLTLNDSLKLALVKILQESLNTEEYDLQSLLEMSQSYFDKEACELQLRLTKNKADN